MSRRRSRRGKEKADGLRFTVKKIQRRVAMAMRWSRRGKEIAEGENGGGGGCKRIAAGAAFCN
ncbi:unnamed protein product [Brassica oleracea var. botrytis]